MNLPTYYDLSKAIAALQGDEPIISTLLSKTQNNNLDKALLKLEKALDEWFFKG